MLQKIFLLFFSMAFGSGAANAPSRFPAVSGQFYPASKSVLKQDIDRYLANVSKTDIGLPSKILGMIVPHAGYQYSGQTAAYAYNILKDHPVDVIVLIGPYHAAQFPGVSIWSHGNWATPLGEILIDEDLAKAIQSESPHFRYDSQIHNSEHSLEVQIPFIQVVAGGTKIVPILISDIRYAKSLAKALYKHLSGRKALVLISTDLSHYHPHSTALKTDQRTLEAFEKQSPDFFINAYRKGDIELCGAAAVLTLLELSHLNGQGVWKNLYTTTSGDVMQDKTNVVGYNTSVISMLDQISAKQGQTLLKLARETLFSYFKNQGTPKLIIDDPILQEKKAVFVTLREPSGKLRGCIGRFEASEPLYLAVQHMIIEAATQDQRFPPVSMNEVKGLLIEISVLDTPVSVESSKDILFGTHGVILSQGSRKGVFLPEVSKDFRTKEDYLSELCFQKVDLPRNCWQDFRTNISIFTTQTIQNPIEHTQ